MHADKAALPYEGRAQLERAMSLLEAHVERVFVSVRPDQVNDSLRAKFAQIVDVQQNIGPLAGILAAQERYPDVAWLVLACDLPFLNAQTLTRLLSARRAQRLATAYKSSHDGLPEPLCAVYEPSSHAALLRHVASGHNCPRKFLLKADVELLDEPDPRALDNVNTREEYGSAVTAMGSTVTATCAIARPDQKRINVQYYALLREQAGRSDEHLVTAARTPRELYQELQQRHSFSLAPEMLRVAVNADFGEWTQPLADGDSVVFIPPVAGG
jgi:molybdopterin-guanine dinucleotide biosynthesis protein A